MALTKKKDYTSAVGRRKSAIANIRLYTKDSDALDFSVNNKDFKKYFNYFEWQDIVLAPLILANRMNAKITVKVQGGGINSQAEAIRLAFARALVAIDGDMRASLRKAGYLTVDARVKERKKPGLKKARRAPQWSKR